MSSQIVAFMHCRKCLQELPEGVSPSQWQSISAGWTKQGFQLWCKRHRINIVHVDFEGVQHKADLSDSGDFDNPLLDETVRQGIQALWKLRAKPGTER